MLQIGNTQVEYRVMKTNILYSRHTKKPLQQVEVSFSVEGYGQYNKLDNIAENQIIVFHHRHFKRVASSYSLAHPNTYMVHWLLEEQEELIIRSLALEEVELKPYFYKEFFDRDFLIINTRIVLKPIDFLRVREITRKKPYFKVVRQGIDEQPINMILGKNYWSEHQERQMKIQYTFIGPPGTNSEKILIPKTVLYGKYFKIDDIDDWFKYL
jgi:hypothetical protein